MCTPRPKMPPPPAPIEPPAPVQSNSSEVTTEAKRAKAEQVKASKAKSGRSSTILTGSLGLDDKARTGKTVLGG